MHLFSLAPLDVLGGLRLPLGRLWVLSGQRWALLGSLLGSFRCCWTPFGHPLVAGVNFQKITYDCRPEMLQLNDKSYDYRWEG